MDEASIKIDPVLGVASTTTFPLIEMPELVPVVVLLSNVIFPVPDFNCAVDSINNRPALLTVRLILPPLVVMTSLPRPPKITSLPAVPERISLPVVPSCVTAPVKLPPYTT